MTNYAYDPNGNQTRSGDRHFAYNLENKLVKVSDKHGHEQVSYTYAEDGLMATRSQGRETTAYSWDTLSDLPTLAIETTSKKGLWHLENKDSRSYTYGESPIGIEAGRDSITFHTDSLGSVVQLSDEKGRLLQSYRYTPFGGDYSSRSSLEAKSDDLNPIRFTGQYLDSETDLYNMRAREYDPETARFLETDPVSCEEGGACGSVYVYVDDRPTVETDPSGMCIPGLACGFWPTPPQGEGSAERRTCSASVHNAWACGIANVLAIEAENKMHLYSAPGQFQLLNNDVQDNTADAFKHMYWSGLLTLDLGSKMAKKITDTHEAGRPCLTDKLPFRCNNAHKMDYHNNLVGRKIAHRAGSSMTSASRGRLEGFAMNETFTGGRAWILLNERARMKGYGWLREGTIMHVATFAYGKPVFAKRKR